MAKIVKRMKKDGTCSYCIRVSNGYDRQGHQVMVNRTFTPPPGLTGKKLEKELQRQADAFEQEVHSGISLDASMKLDDLIERWFTEYADRQLEAQDGHRIQKAGATRVRCSGSHEGQPDTPGAPHGVLCEPVRGRSAARFHLYGNGCAAEAAAERPAGKDPGNRRSGRGNHAGVV